MIAKRYVCYSSAIGCLILTDTLLAQHRIFGYLFYNLQRQRLDSVSDLSAVPSIRLPLPQLPQSLLCAIVGFTAVFATRRWTHVYRQVTRLQV